ncbi:response regulator transcription factor [Paractinoplanes lichenicola]|uniref:Response regulator n=1 Tax=Paractinoplanes lichenicola TaxID=2802976 RepID=A0ABS1VVJ6_9ACTN|nr:response regulator [Actinoplanes lichenicola]MBL7258495.1 response regulator [Actinoplanes lichenicola]
MNATAAAPVVLIAEDDEDIRDLISWKLEVAGFRTLHAGNGKTAVELAAEHRPDAAVLDINMPAMDGLEVCQNLRRDEGTANIPVLMLSARVNDSDIESGYGAGADDYMTKPFNPQELLRRLEGLLSDSAV